MSIYATTQLAGRCPGKWGSSRLFVYIQPTKICNFCMFCWPCIL